MPRLPARPSLDHLKKQAKGLLTRYRAGDADAIARFRSALPAATGKPDHLVAGLGLRLRDAQSCLAREYGFASWVDIKSFVEARMASLVDHPAQVLGWLRLVYAGDISGSGNRARPAVAARMLEENPALLHDDPYLACAVGDVAKLRHAIVRDPGWVNRPGGPLNLPPLVAVAHSSLMRLADHRDGLHACARLLLEAGADADQSVGNRWSPASLSEPSEKDRLSALYGAAGQNHDPALTRLLLEAGADPNDGESLYHSLESPPAPRSCSRPALVSRAAMRSTARSTSIRRTRCVCYWRMVATRTNQLWDHRRPTGEHCCSGPLGGNGRVPT